jgi:hypothetical protein
MMIDRVEVSRPVGGEDCCLESQGATAFRNGCGTGETSATAVAAARDAAGLSQAGQGGPARTPTARLVSDTFAEKSGLTQREISLIEHALCFPSVETAERLASGFGYELSRLIILVECSR